VISGWSCSAFPFHRKWQLDHRAPAEKKPRLTRCWTRRLPVPRWSTSVAARKSRASDSPRSAAGRRDPFRRIEQRSVVRSSVLSRRESKRCSRAGTRCWFSASFRDVSQRWHPGRRSSCRLPRSISANAAGHVAHRLLSLQVGNGERRRSGRQANCPADLSEESPTSSRNRSRRRGASVAEEGFGRCDFRIDQSGRPWLLEVNAIRTSPRPPDWQRMAESRLSAIPT